MDSNKKLTRVLIMDDEPVILEIFSEDLATLGYFVVTFEEGEGALGSFVAARYAGAPFDVVVLDLENKRGWGGEETLKKMKEVDPNVKAILMTGNLGHPVVEKYAELGFSDLLAKPFGPEVLDHSIQLLLSK